MYATGIEVRAAGTGTPLLGWLSCMPGTIHFVMHKVEVTNLSAMYRLGAKNRTSAYNNTFNTIIFSTQPIEYPHGLVRQCFMVDADDMATLRHSRSFTACDTL